MGVGKKDLQSIEKALKVLSEQVNDLKVNAVKLKGADPKETVAWQVEDVHANKLYLIINSLKENPTMSIEADIGQFLEITGEVGQQLLQWNFSETNLSKLALTPDGRLMVLHRRWFEDVTERAIIDAVAEVWNVAHNLRQHLQPMKPGVC